MPIQFLENRHRMQRVGRIRQGHAVISTRDGKEIKRPVADPFFNVSEDVARVVGQNPVTLKIMFLSDHLEDTFPHYLRRYTAKGLRCLGDGESVLYRVSDEDVRDVSDGSQVDTKGRAMQDANAMWIKVPCGGSICPDYIAGACKATGYLRFMLTEMPRLGYWDLVCHQRAVIVVKTQLELALRTFGRLTNIPFILHRGEEERVPVMVKGQLKEMPIRTPWVEVDPEWFQQNVSRVADILQESQNLRRLQAGQDVSATISELYGGETPETKGYPSGAAKIVEEFEEETFEGEKEAIEEAEEVVVEAPPVVSRSANSAMTAAEVHSLWAMKAPSDDGIEPSGNQRGLAVNILERAAGTWGKNGRKLVSHYLFGIDTSLEWTKAMAEFILDLWCSGKDEKTGAYGLKEHAVAEVAAVIKAAQLANGQQELPDGKEQSQ